MLRARYVRAKQNGRHMLDNDGYKYRVVKNRPQKTYYECVFKTTQHCPATAVVLKATDIIISQNGKHNHDNNLLCEQVSTYGKTPLKVYMDSILAFYNR